MNIDFRGLTDLVAAVRGFSEKHNKALAYTLTGMAFEVRKSTQSKLPEWVKVTRPFLKNSVFYKRATPDSLESAVGFSDKAKPIMSLLEFGGNRAPKRTALAVPIEAKRTARGGIGASQKPARLIARKDTFTGTSKGGLGGIWKRLKQGGLSLLYAFKGSTSYDAGQTEFYKNGADVVKGMAVSKYQEAIRKFFG